MSSIYELKKDSSESSSGDSGWNGNFPPFDPQQVQRERIAKSEESESHFREPSDEELANSTNEQLIERSRNLDGIRSMYAEREQYNAGSREAFKENPKEPDEEIDGRYGYNHRVHKKYISEKVAEDIKNRGEKRPNLVELEAIYDDFPAAEGEDAGDAAWRKRVNKVYNIELSEADSAKMLTWVGLRDRIKAEPRKKDELAGDRMARVCQDFFTEIGQEIANNPDRKLSLGESELLKTVYPRDVDESEEDYSKRVDKLVGIKTGESYEQESSQMLDTLASMKEISTIPGKEVSPDDLKKMTADELTQLEGSLARTIREQFNDSRYPEMDAFLKAKGVTAGDMWTMSPADMIALRKQQCDEMVAMLTSPDNLPVLESMYYDADDISGGKMSAMELIDLANQAGIPLEWSKADDKSDRTEAEDAETKERTEAEDAETKERTEILADLMSSGKIGDFMKVAGVSSEEDVQKLSLSGIKAVQQKMVAMDKAKAATASAQTTKKVTPVANQNPPKVSQPVAKIVSGQKSPIIRADSAPKPKDVLTHSAEGPKVSPNTPAASEKSTGAKADGNEADTTPKAFDPDALLKEMQAAEAEAKKEGYGKIELTDDDFRKILNLQQVGDKKPEVPQEYTLARSAWNQWSIKRRHDAVEKGIIDIGYGGYVRKWAEEGIRKLQDLGIIPTKEGLKKVEAPSAENTDAAPAVETSDGVVPEQPVASSERVVTSAAAEDAATNAFERQREAARDSFDPIRGLTDAGRSIDASDKRLQEIAGEGADLARIKNAIEVWNGMSNREKAFMMQGRSAEIDSAFADEMRSSYDTLRDAGILVVDDATTLRQAEIGNAEPVAAENANGGSEATDYSALDNDDFVFSSDISGSSDNIAAIRQQVGSTGRVAAGEASRVADILPDGGAVGPEDLTGQRDNTVVEGQSVGEAVESA